MISVHGSISARSAIRSSAALSASLPKLAECSAPPFRQHLSTRPERGTSIR